MLHIRRALLVVCLNIVLVCAADITAETSDQVATNNNNNIYIPTCNETNTNIEDCLLKVFQYILPHSKNGIPELNVPPIDPFSLNRTKFIFTHPFFNGKLALRNLKAHGFSDLKMKRIQYERKGNEIFSKADAFLPKIFIEGEYKAKIRFNQVNISSRGPFNVTFTNVNASHDFLLEVYEKDDGHMYMEFKAFNLKPIIGGLVFKADGLLPEPLLNDAILEFVNQNWRTMYKILIPETRAAWEPEMVRLANVYFSRIPVDAVLKQ